MRSPSMRRLALLLDRLREVDLPVLIEGEMGSGKELVARALHAESRRAAVARTWIWGSMKAGRTVRPAASITSSGAPRSASASAAPASPPTQRKRPSTATRVVASGCAGSWVRTRPFLSSVIRAVTGRL